MIDVSNEIKQAYDLSTTQVDKIILDGQEYRITNVQYYDDVYEKGNIFGTAIARGLEFEIENVVDLEKKEVEYLTGVQIDGITNWISLGNFIVQDVEPNDTTNIAKITAMDYMIKTNIPFASKLKYSDGTVTLADVLNEACINSGLTCATLVFPNSDFVVDSNQFDEGTLNRQVIQAVAQLSGTVAKVKNDNRLYLISPQTTVSKVFTLNNYKEAEIKRATHPINLVSIGMADITGENITLRDETNITENGENSLVINDNPFAYTQAKREQLITALFNAVKGFEYKAYTFECQGLPYLETMDKVQFLDKEGNTYNSFIFRFNYKSPKGLESTIEAPSIIKATVDYQNLPSALDIAKRTEIIVDKQNQTITSIVSQTDEQNQKIAQITQSVDEIKSQMSDIADITISADGYGNVSLTNINESEPVYIRVRPTSGEDISYLYPRDNLFPSDDLFMPDRIIRFKSADYTVDYELPDNLLYWDENNYDEFILDYNAQTCVVNRKVGYNADGTKRLLDTPKTTEYPYPTIPIKNGDYTITLPGYKNPYIFVRMMVQNIYTDQFSTKAEVKSQISQTASSINLSVDQKLSNYSTTTQMNAAINLKADSITSNVSKTYSTKSETATAKSQAIDSANASTDDKLKGYSTTVQMNSAITQKANEITSSVSATYATKNQVTTLKTEIKQTTDSIQSQVSKNGTELSTIKQTVNEVNIEVGKKYNTSDFTNAKITAKINDGTSSVLIKASRIDLSGYLTVSSASSTYASKSGLSGGTTTINGNCITTGTIDASKVTVKNLNASNITSGTISASKINGGTITASAINLGNGKFAVTTAGALTATNATISGKITATSGKIGGFTIESNTMVASGTNCRVYVSNASNSTKDFLVVETGNSTSGYQWPFVVRGDGSLYASKAEISGKITATSGSFRNCTISNCNINNTDGGTALFGSVSATATIKGTIIDGGGVYAVPNSGTGFAYRGYWVGEEYGKDFDLIVQHQGQYWRKLVFKSGILVAVQSSW